MGLSCTILYHYQDITRYWLKIAKYVLAGLISGTGPGTNPGGDAKLDISAEFLPLYNDYNPANRKILLIFAAKPHFVEKQNLRLKFGYSPTFTAKLLLFKFDLRCAYM